VDKQKYNKDDDGVDDAVLSIVFDDMWAMLKELTLE